MTENGVECVTQNAIKSVIYIIFFYQKRVTPSEAAPEVAQKRCVELELSALCLEVFITQGTALK